VFSSSAANLLKKLMSHRKKPLHLVLDGPPAHKTPTVKDSTYRARTARLRAQIEPG
jgi:hypothetical protein